MNKIQIKKKILSILGTRPEAIKMILMMRNSKK
jgi:UDP-N-acetylglucosamine 2-epimerase